jgi:K+-sensing histidine kinase KdpD
MMSPRSADAPVCLNPATFALLFNSSKALASTTDLDELLNVIVAEVQKVLQCEGAGLLLYDADRKEFYWRTVKDKQSFLESARDQITIPGDQGVCGWVFKTGTPALVDDAVNDPRIYRPVETRSGFTTRNMVCVPLQSREKRLGVLYALNKIGEFSTEDVEIMSALAGNVALAIENATYLEDLTESNKELERMNRVKNKMLNHLSHELKTPLAIIEASVHIVERKLESAGIQIETLALDRIKRNVDRLKLIEEQVSDIVYRKNEGASFDLELSCGYPSDGTMPGTASGDAYSGQVEFASVQSAFKLAEEEITTKTQERELDIRFIDPTAECLRIQPRILMSLLMGILRNAVENTPDYGRITVSGEMRPEGYVITISDTGVGIPESEQPNVFEGFYPLREIDLYSSGRRYDFNAGGTGMDLLKFKVFSARFGFKLRFKSERCSWIPTTKEICPGDIRKCRYCLNVEDCFQNGGTTFFIEFPGHPADEVQT